LYTLSKQITPHGKGKKTQKEKLSFGTSFSFLAVPPNLPPAGKQKTPVPLKGRESESRVATQLAIRPTLTAVPGGPVKFVICSSRAERPASLLPRTIRQLSEKLYSLLLYHRLCEIEFIINTNAQSVKTFFI
jgi:hypothetical protein